MYTSFSYYGSKYRLASKIIETMSSHNRYIEPYAGTAIVLLSKYRTEYDVLNDLSSEITNFFTVVRDSCEELYNYIETFPYCEETLKYAQQEQDDDEFELAVKYFLRCNLSFEGRGENFSGHIKNRKFFKTRLSNLFSISERLQQVIISNAPALELLQQDQYTLIYCDPPYYSDERVSKTEYKHEMGRHDHIQLLKAVLQTPAMVLISGYNNQLYNNYLSEWNRKELRAVTSYGNASQGERVEVLWANYPLC